MTERLFQGFWHSAWTHAIQKAVEDVDGLDRKIFSDPALAGHLQRIAEKYSFDVARIKKEGIQATRRETARAGRDAWGDQRVFKQTWLDVTIPFTGEAESFKIAPSRSLIPSHGASIGRDALTLTIPDDERAQSEVDTFVSQVSQNLDGLRAEYEQSKPQLQQAINSAADRRKAQIDAERERDKKLSFPVRG
jgi:hypothetical protein